MDKNAWKIAGWICAILIAAGVCWELLNKDWSGSIILGIFFGATVAFLMARNRLPSLFAFLFGFACLINGAGWVFNLFNKIPLYDKFVHAFTCFASALAIGFSLFYSSSAHFRHHRIVFAITITAYGIALGALWEPIELLMNVVETRQNSLMDIVADAVGSILAGAFAAWAIGALPEERLQE